LSLREKRSGLNLTISLNDQIGKGGEGETKAKVDTRGGGKNGLKQ
jgi:hypothetical protein